MNKRLIIDSQLAAQSMSNVFERGWNWPVPQANYDRLVTEVIEWADELHLELGDSPRLLTAFLLIKADLLKDLSYYLAGWLDVAKARENGTELVFSPDQYIYSSLLSDEFINRIPTKYNATSKRGGLKGTIRARLSRIKRARNNRSASRSTDTARFLIGANPLAVQITGNEVLRVGFNLDDIARHRPALTETPGRLSELADRISTEVVDAISRNTLGPSKQFISHIRYITSTHLKKGWRDAGLKSIFSPTSQNSTLVTGTGSGYAARLLSHQFLSDGFKVIRASHGGEAPLFNDLLWSSIELPFATNYVVHGASAAAATTETITKRTEAAVPQYASSVIAVGSRHHASIREAARPPVTNLRKTVSVISESLTGMHRITPHMKPHDVVYMEWHRRLLQDIGRLGYTVFAKRHPKGMMAGKNIFDDVSTEELLQTSMASIEQRTDVYVIDFAAAAFMESICTLKPVVFIDLKIRLMRPEVRSFLRKSVAIVDATFDQDNRVTIDQSDLREALETPVDLDARDEFLKQYLLRPSSNVDSLFE